MCSRTCSLHAASIAAGVDVGGYVSERASVPVSARHRRLWWTIGVAGAAAIAVAVLGVTLSSSMHPATGRGEPLQTLPSSLPRPVPTDAALAADKTQAATVDDVWSSARTSVEAKALTRSDCLDSAAKAYATAAAKTGGTGGSPEKPSSNCDGDVTFGYMLGFDSTGVSQATAALSATGKGSSPLVAEGEKNVGYALVESRGSTGDVNGYVLAWAVSK